MRYKSSPLCGGLGDVKILKYQCRGVDWWRFCKKCINKDVVLINQNYNITKKTFHILFGEFWIQDLAKTCRFFIRNPFSCRVMRWSIELGSYEREFTDSLYPYYQCLYFEHDVCVLPSNVLSNALWHFIEAPDIELITIYQNIHSWNVFDRYT